ncbi:MAG: tetratricopeptide repeat protein [Pseudomonadota bacterium]
MANTQLWTPDKDRPFRLAGRTIDPTIRTIEHAGRSVTVEPRVLALLLQLAETPGEPQRREALIDAVWPGSPGAESSLSNAVSLLRQALGDSDSSTTRLIRTVPKFGYCLAVAPEPVAAEQPRQRASRPAAPWRRWRLPLLGVSVVLGLVTLALVRQNEPVESAPSRLDSMQPFVAVTRIDAPPTALPFAHVLAQDAAASLARVNAYRVADESEAYQVASGALVADLVVSGTLTDTDAGPVLTATWVLSATGETVAMRRLTATPGAVLALRRDWLESVVVETALALTEAGYDLSVGSADTVMSSASEEQWLEPPTDIATAFEAYSDGLWKAAQYRADLMIDAIANFERAVALDPNFAAAWADLGHAYLMAGSHQGAMAPERTHESARDALLRAVTLQPDLIDAHNTLADYYNCVAREPLLAQRAFDSVFALEPGFASAGYTRLLLLHATPQAAIAQIERNLARFPDSLLWKLIAAQHFLAAGAVDDALRQADSALALAPGMTEARLTRAKTLSVQNRHDLAIAELESLLASEPDSARIATLLVVALARAERLDDATAVFESVVLTKAQVRATHLAMGFAWLGRTDQAFEQLDIALAAREFGLCYVAVEPIYEPLRADARFTALVERMRGASFNSLSAR